MGVFRAQVKCASGRFNILACLFSNYVLIYRDADVKMLAITFTNCILFEELSNIAASVHVRFWLETSLKINWSKD